MDPREVLPITAAFRYVAQSAIQLISHKELFQVLQGFSHLLARTCFLCRLLWGCWGGGSDAPCREVLWHPAPPFWPCHSNSVLWWWVLPGGQPEFGGAPPCPPAPTVRRQENKLKGSPGHGAAKKQFSFLSPSTNSWLCKELRGWQGRDLMPRDKSFPPCFPRQTLSPQSR